jgi:Prp8 binding protein
MSEQKEKGNKEESSINRTSNSKDRNLLLTGHHGEVFTMKFSPNGMAIASGSIDKTILLWRISTTKCEKYMTLNGHKKAVIELHWTQNGDQLVSCSPDHTVRFWDTSTSQEISKKEHRTIVNSCSSLKVGPPLVVSGDDDGNVKVWDFRAKTPALSMWDPYPVTSVAIADEGYTLYYGGIDNTIKTWDLRKRDITVTLHGHSNTITGLKVSPNGAFLLSNSMDNTLRIWDIKSTKQNNRSIKVMTGHLHTCEKNLIKCDWCIDGSLVSAGGGNNTACVWKVASRRIVHKVTSHLGTVNEVAFDTKHSRIGSCSSDGQIILNEIQT